MGDRTERAKTLQKTLIDNTAKIKAHPMAKMVGGIDPLLNASLAMCHLLVEMSQDIDQLKQS